MLLRLKLMCRFTHVYAMLMLLPGMTLKDDVYEYYSWSSSLLWLYNKFYLYLLARWSSSYRYR